MYMMKKGLFYAALVLAMGCVALTGCKGKEAADDNQLYSSSKPYTRWWWFSSNIDTNDVRDQLVWLKDHEFGGVEIAWIYPIFLDSATAHPEFLSPEWSRPVEVAKRGADSLGLGCDFTYGTLWPFSDLNLPDGDQSRNYFDSGRIAERQFTWDFPKRARVINHLNKDVFYRYAAKMNKGLANAYKGSKSGLFVDSWEVETEYLWTPGFGETFIKEHGYDLEPYMRDSSIYKDENADVKYDYMSTLSEYVMKEFYGPFADNARSVGAFSRSQCAGAPTDLLTAYTLVDVPETEAILYEPSFSKIAASAAALSGKPVVTAETFTCAYGWTGLFYKKGRGHSPHQGKEQIADLKLICDGLFANGTNQIVWHGFPFNKVGDTSQFFYTTCQISTSDLNNLTGDNLTQFNKYMTTVSKYMRRGVNYSDLAVYMPLEDSWMVNKYPDSVLQHMLGRPWQFEMRYIRTPESLKGMHPLWVNGHYLASASVDNGVMHCGEADFKGLYVDVEHVDYSALKSILRLAKEGLPVCMVRDPVEPGKVKHDDYASMLAELHTLPNVATDASAFAGKPLVEGENLPDFWCRQDGETCYIFFANPLTQTIRYPLDYCYAFTDKGSHRDVVINHHGKSDKISLDFAPTESLLFEVSASGVKKIDLGFTPQKMNGYVEK